MFTFLILRPRGVYVDLLLTCFLGNGRLCITDDLHYNIDGKLSRRSVKLRDSYIRAFCCPGVWCCGANGSGLWATPTSFSITSPRCSKFVTFPISAMGELPFLLSCGVTMSSNYNRARRTTALLLCFCSSSQRLLRNLNSTTQTTSSVSTAWRSSCLILPARQAVSSPGLVEGFPLSNKGLL